MAEQQLDLLKLAATTTAKLRACAAEIVGRDTRYTCCLGVVLYELPDDLFAQHFACDSVSAINWTEDVTFRHTGRRCPSIDGHLNPGRHRNGADATVLADQVNDAPTAIALLQVREGECSHLGAPQTAAEKNREDSFVAQSPACRDVRGAQQRLRLPL